MAMLNGLVRALGRIDEIRGLMEVAAQSPGGATTTATAKGSGASFAGALDSALQSTGGRSAGLRPRIDALVQEAATRYGVDANLIHAVIRAESDYDPDCISSAGAMGLMQLMPENCREYGVSDPYDCAQNISAGVRQLKQMMERFGSLDLALAAYNAGPGAVSRYGGVPPYRETQAYVRKITGWLASGQ
jgi:soluble lytic murein transglycosylase-like protein